MKQFQEWYKEHKQEIEEEFFNYLRFPSISAHKDRRESSIQCSEFLMNKMKKIGLDVQLIETSENPFIVGTYCHAGDNKPTLLLYLHYDVQPIDPIELWKSNPFEPEKREGKIFARGASDNKGQGFYTLTAIESFIKLKEISNFNLKVIIEGGEETGSVGLIESLPKYGSLLAADYLLVVDSSMESLDKPQICLGMKGIACFDLRVKTADIDLHSGEWGGVAANSLKVMIDALSSVTDEQGKILIDHFYDDVVDATEKEKQVFFAQDWDRTALKRQPGIHAFSPEPGYSLVESAWMRPTFEVNGMWGGYTEDGFKTVIPAQAFAKLSFRTVKAQDSKRIEELFKKHLEKVMPSGVKWELIAHGAGRYLKSDIDSKIVHVAQQAYSDVFGKECRLGMIGGSVPVGADLAEASGASCIGIGTATLDNQIHAPNEFFYEEAFEKGFLTITRILDILQSELSNE